LSSFSYFWVSLFCRSRYGAADDHDDYYADDDDDDDDDVYDDDDVGAGV
jgi:hypothetical protein